MHIFYTANINDLFLDKEESHHCTKVLRLKENDEIVLIDGKGTYARGVIIKTSEKKVQFRIIDQTIDPGKLHYDLHLAVAPTKNINRYEWFIEKATEIGVSEIIPLLCENSERTVIKNERLEKIIISAAKQSQKATFPVLHEMLTFKDFIKSETLHTGMKLIAHCAEGEMVYLNSINKKKKITLCIGPEGDFSQTEIKLALAAGFQPVTFGKSRLRTETAAVYACSAINLLNQSFNSD